MAVLSPTTADSIKATLANPQKVSSATVETLRQFLYPETSDATAKLAAKLKDGKKRINGSRPAKGKSLKSVPVPPTTSNGTKSDSNSAHTKLCLATHVFNATLKNLSDELKAQRKRQESGTGSKVRESPAYIVPIAVCAHLALTYLCGHEKESGDKLPALQVDNGILSLLDKCTALTASDEELIELAYQDLHILKARLDRYLAAEASKSLDVEEKIAYDVPFNPQRVPELFAFNSKPTATAIRSLVISYQYAALKFLQWLGYKTALEESISHLWISECCSPTSLLEEQAAHDDLQEKTALQMDRLSGVLFSIAKTHGNILDVPTIAKLKTIALQARVLRWLIVKDHPDMEKELWAPLAKVYCLLSRTPGIDYDTWYTFYDQLQSHLQHEGQFDVSDANLDVEGGHADVMDGLITIARSASRCEKAFDLILARYNNVVNAAQTVGISEAKRLFVTVQYAESSLSRNLNHPHRLEILKLAANRLGGSIKGSPEFLHKLFSEVSILQKAASKFFLDNSCSEHAETREHECSESQEEALTCMSIVFHSMKFLLRFISTSGQNNGEAEESHSKRLSIATKAAKGFVNSVLLCCKRQITASNIEFTVLDTPLQDTVAVANHLEISGVTIRVSHLYLSFARSNADRSDTAKESDVKAVKRSVEVLANASVQEKDSGLYTTNLEYLAEVYASTRNIARACSYLTTSAHHQIQAGVLKTVAALASTTPLRVIAPSAESSRFQKTLRTMQQLLLKAKETDQAPFFDDDELPDDERGILLEWQLQRMLDWCPSPQMGRKVASQIPALLRTLLSVYTFENFPIRRTRVIVTYLRTCPSDLAPVDNSLPLKFVSSGRVVSPGKDAGLIHYAPHLVATLRVYNAFANLVDLAEAKDALGEWQRIFDNARSYSDLKAQVDDVEDWTYDMSSVADFLDRKDLARFSIPTRSLLDSIYHLKGTLNPGIVANLSKLGLVWARIGYSGKARSCLDKAKTFLFDKELPHVRLEYHLALAEQSILAFDPKECSKALQDAKVLAMTIPELSGGLSITLNFWERLKYTRMMADACYTSAQYYLADNSKIMEALSFARQAVKLNQKAWANAQNKLNPKPLDAKPDIDTDIDAAQHSTGEASTSEEAPKVPLLTPDALTGTDLWKIASPLLRSYMLLSKIYAHNGLFQESRFYAEHARNIAVSVSSTSQIWRTKCHCLALHVAAGKFDGKFDNAMALLEEIKGEVKCDDELNPLDKIYYSWTAALHFGARSAAGYALAPEEEKKLYEEPLREIEECATNPPSERFDVASEKEDLAVQLDRLKIADVEEPVKGRKKTAKPTATSTTTKTNTASRTRKTKVNPDAAKTTSKPKSRAKTMTRNTGHPDGASDLQPVAVPYSICCDILLSNALVFSLPEPTGFVDKLLEAISLPSNENEVLENIWVSCLALKYVLDRLAASPAFSAFQESVIALPAAASSKVEPVEESGSNADSLIRDGSTLRPPKSKLSRKKANEPMEVFDDLVEPILSARRHLISAPSQVMMSSPTHVLHRVFGIGSDMSTLLSVLTQNLPGLKIHPLAHALGLDSPRNFAFQRELAVIKAEIEKKERSTAPTWPAGADIQTQSPGPEVFEFQQQYVDVLPPTWTVISMILNHAKDELSICRYRSGESPFILRLPIARSNLIDPGDEGLDYQAAKKELKTIVDLSNYSAHEAKNITASAAKTQWWDGRKALDERMRDLLINMEKSWLGGFKGIFAQQPKHPQLLANFQQALQMSLNRHLPSRRGQSGTSPIQFDPRVLELFTGLGDPNDRDVDLDDTLSELLYFVVDSLNFNGEPNAFDEVDFDSVTISTTHKKNTR